MVNAEIILPKIETCFVCLKKLIVTKNFWLHFLNTFLRVIFAFIISTVAGIILGILCSYFSFFNTFLEIPLVIIRSTPVIAIILLALFWFNSSQVPIFVAVLMTLPIMISAVYTGFSQKDDKMEEMAEIFLFTDKQKLFYIKLPSAIPSIMNGVISTFGLTWKVVVAGEVLSIPRLGLGSLMQKAQVHLEPEMIFSLTFVLVFVSFILEKLLKFFERRICGTNSSN
ncbi:MAG: ABC transporter permease subunit [Treponema sp.]|nr:ABC transporter permease subunit [Treponema sp.]